MEIKNKTDLCFFLKADLMMNRGVFCKPLGCRIKELISKDIIIDYLVTLRKYEYYLSRYQNAFSGVKTLYFYFFYMLYKRRWLKLGIKTGFSIGPYCFGYGLVLQHHGTIVVGNDNRIGNFCNINTSTCIVQNGSSIGNFFFMGTGAVITKNVVLGDNVLLGANSVLSNSYNNDNILLAGSPALVKKELSGNWCSSLYGPSWKKRMEEVQKLYQKTYER